MHKRQLLTATLCAAWACTGLSAMAQAYPTKPITMVVPFPPGGVADTVGRPVAEAMSRHLKQSIVVENKGGAGGGIDERASAWVCDGSVHAADGGAWGGVQSIAGGECV